MATLYVAEFSAMATHKLSHALIAQQPPVTEQTVSIGMSSTQSSAFNSATRMIRVHTDAICSILVGADPTATSSKMRMAANQTEYFGVQAGDKIAVITNS